MSRRKKTPGQLDREIRGHLAHAKTKTKKQTYRVEIRFDVHGTQADAEKEAQRAAAAVGGEVTAIFDENFDEI